MTTSVEAKRPSAEEYREAIAIGKDLSARLPSIQADSRMTAAQLELAAREEPIGGLLVTDLTNIRYLTGFTGSSARLLLTATSATLITDSRYAERATEELANVHCKAQILIERTMAGQDNRLKEILSAHSVGQLGLEANDVSWVQLRSYESLFDTCVLVPTGDFVEKLRRTKDLGEVARLARASAIADAALATVVSQLASGPTEIAFAQSLERAMSDLGSQAPSFDTIIASGPNASRPHHSPSDRVIANGDEVICDFGATVDGYHSDMTRTVYVGEPSNEQKRHFGVVAAAQRAGVSRVIDGVRAVDVDTAARTVITDVGWGEYFGHGTGHGSGLEIHEAPWLGPTSLWQLAHGDIVTVEPGVYLPGVGGVRVEDSMVVTDTGPLLLTMSPYELVVS